ncbi:AAA family ATPase [Niameybacter massiliensis]|uniref:Nuclease SbcCD subunit C n=1 Tax=Holtiella tumoricola TaxID=3018743 RepID=A0AA42DNZ7_9FIRM|nr:AAA family ATPase [Holtiella tumoricola]MDA3732445.1 AAA family ATPase [Holtiella tumoricola]
MMRINKVKIENFKTYKEKVEFDFRDSKFILISGPNGYGKTTIIEAIEWGITGRIRRIENNFNERNTTKTERNRQENNAGIIKNRTCSSEEYIKVELEIDINGQVIHIIRKQKDDKLDIESELEISGELSEENRQELIKLIKEDSFYQYHVCDTQKAYRFMNMKREDVKNQFDDFLKNREKENTIIEVLECAQKWNIDLIDQEKGKLISEDQLKQKNSKLQALKGANSEEKNYPLKKIFIDEKVDLISEPMEVLMQQKKSLKEVGYKKLSNSLNTLKYNNILKHKIILFETLLSKYNENREVTNKAIELKLYNNECIDILSQEIRQLQEFTSSLTCENLVNKREELKTLLTNISVRIFEENQIEIVSNLKQEILNVEEIIKDKQAGNNIIKVLSDIVGEKQSLILFQKEGDRCPVCGKEGFSSIEYDDITKEAEVYLRKARSDIGTLKLKLKAKQEEYNKLLLELKEEAKQNLNKKIEEKEIKLKEFEEIYNNTKEVFDLCKQLGIDYVSSIIDDAILLEYQNSIKSQIISSEHEKKIQEEVCNYLNLLGLEEIELVDNMNYQNSLVKLNSYIETAKYYEQLDFEFELFREKWIVLEKICKNKEIIDLENEIIKTVKENESINSRILELTTQNTQIKNKIDIIRSKLSVLEAEELHSVGEYLYKIFYKIIKHTSIGEFKIVRDRAKVNAGTTIQDDKNVNILNILSEGQLSTFMIALFLGNAFRRTNETVFKTYFLDDITNSMDDMNVLSLVEIIKYQLNIEEGVFNQFFFSTCDNSLEKMFIHKMNSFGIEWQNIKFKRDTHGVINYYNNEQIKF